MGRKTEDIQHLVMICTGSDCTKKGAKKIGKSIRDCARKHGCKKDTMIVQTKCTGLCKQAPVVFIQRGNRWVTGATEKRAVKAFQASFASL